MFSVTYPIKYNDLDKNMVLKPSALFEFLEDIAAQNANELQFGYDNIYSKNYGWFLLKYAIEFTEYPQKISALKLETQSRGANKLFAFRDFYIYGDNDKLLGKVASTWALVDLTNKKMLNPLETLNDNITVYEKQETDLTYNKIPNISYLDTQKTIKVEYYDIDVNNHVNNANYIKWALETLPIEYLADKRIKRIDINYKKDITIGEEIISQTSIIKDTTVHYLRSTKTNDLLCSILIKW